MAGGVAMAEELIDQIPAMIEKGGLPAVVGGALFALLWKFGGKRDDPEEKLVLALNALTKEVRDMRNEMTDRLARAETRLDNLDHKK